MAEAFRSVDAPLECVTLMEGKSHTDPILEDPAGGEDELTIELMAKIHASDSDNPAILPGRLHPVLQGVARWLNPF
jgi:hypothetical protein